MQLFASRMSRWSGTRRLLVDQEEEFTNISGPVVSMSVTWTY